MSALGIMVFLGGTLLFGTGLTAYAYAQGQLSGQFPQSIVVFSSIDPTPHSLELATIQEGNAESSEVSGLSLDTTNTVTVQPNSQLTVFVTDNTVQVIGAKVRTATDQLIDLNPSTQANAFSIANLPVGTYTLDVITQKGNTKAAYEGILVIGQGQASPLPTPTPRERGDGDNGDNDIFIIDTDTGVDTDTDVGDTDVGDTDVGDTDVGDTDVGDTGDSDGGDSDGGDSDGGDSDGGGN